MNCDVYFFGKFKNGYMQYPMDDAQIIFQKFCKNANTKSQIAIHRNGNLMYYSYIRKLDEDNGLQSIFGICILLNEVMICSISKLFSFFENIFMNIVERGKILKENSKSEIISPAHQFLEEQHEIIRITEFICNKIICLKKFSKILPILRCNIVNNSEAFLSINEDNSTIIEASCKCCYTYIFNITENQSKFLSNSKKSISKVIIKKDEDNFLGIETDKIYKTNFKKRSKNDSSDHDFLGINN